MNDNLVSIITPVFNSERFLAETIESVLNQTYACFEMILVDDCSIDGSKEIIEKYMSKDSRIKYFAHEKNQGAAAARNTALANAQGRYIAFLDSDDIWKDDKLEKQISHMQTENAGFCFAAIEMVNEDGSLKKGKRKIKKVVSYKYILKRTVIPTSTVIVDRSVFGDFRMPDRRSGQDYATWLMLLRSGKNAYGIDEALVKYRVSRNSLSSGKFKSVKQVYEIQTKQEKIKPFFAFINCMFFMWFAFLKYFF